GSPVIAARAASLPEVAGDAAWLVDPQDPRDLAEALQGLLADPERRRDFAEAGKKRAARFSWQRCARETLRVFERVAARKQARRS
ncbi:MAG: glycosyltransferase family 1 protein, partial [Syntrophobacteraceae bacterium CG07_land_8_20_14_0_80_61_8]